MHRRYPLLVALTVLAVAIGAWDGMRVMHNSGLPFAVSATGTRAVRVEPLHDVPLPSGLRAGETIDLRTQPFATRAAILASLTEGSVRPGERPTLKIERGGRPMAIALTTRRLGAVPELRLASWLGVLWAALICLTALITLWRGKDWGAWGISLWAIAFEAGLALTLAPTAGAGIVAVGVASPFLYLIARVGFYLMAESIAAPALTARTRRVLRAAFAALLLAGMAYEIAAPLALLFRALLVPQLIATVWALPYLLATAMLLLGYRRADARHRQRLHWTFWSSLVFVVGIQFSNVPLLGYPLSFVVEIGAYAVSMTGLLYAVLRHRVVGITFIVNRALVYSAALTAVVGIFALLESFLEKAALPRNAGFAVELGVPLVIGFSLEAVRKRLEQLSERVFFRKRFKAEQALRAFARHCGYIEHPDRLTEETLRELVIHTGAPATALYWKESGRYRRVNEAGASCYAPSADVDDRAMVALRAERGGVDLEAFESGIGTDGVLLPMLLRGELLGTVAIANRPGEHYPAEDLELFSHLVHEVGAAMHALLARGNARLIGDLAAGKLNAQEAMERARGLTQQV